MIQSLLLVSRRLCELAPLVLKFLCLRSLFRCEVLLSEGELTAMRAEHTGDARPPRGCQEEVYFQGQSGRGTGGHQIDSLRCTVLVANVLEELGAVSLSRLASATRVVSPWQYACRSCFVPWRAFLCRSVSFSTGHMSD